MVHFRRSAWAYVPQMGHCIAIENFDGIPTKSACLDAHMGVIWSRLSEDRHLSETRFSRQPAQPQGAICCSQAGRTSSSFLPTAARGHYAMPSNPGRSDLPGFLASGVSKRPWENLTPCPEMALKGPGALSATCRCGRCRQGEETGPPTSSADKRSVRKGFSGPGSRC